MRKLDQRGLVDTWLVAFSLTLVAFVGSLIFGFWAFAGRQDYKTNVDAKITEAVGVAETNLSAKKDAEFAEKEKEPLRTYTGPSAYGSLTISYPKTWSAYIDEGGSGSGSGTPLNGFLNPSFVPSVQSDTLKNNIALRFQVSSSAYTVTVRALESQVKAGKIKTTPYVAPKVSGATGVRVDGEIATGKQGSKVILPLRDKTLIIWTESPQFVADFDNLILPNFTFVP